MSEDIKKIMSDLCSDARDAYIELGAASSEQKNDALKNMAAEIRSGAAAILDANAKDVEAAHENNLSRAMIDRLILDDKRNEAIAAGIEAMIVLDDPVGKNLDAWDGNNNGLKISKVSVPLGVIGIIYESRPNVTADAGALCLKSGNAVILRGGSDSFHSSNAIVDAMHKGMEKAGISKNAIQLVPTKSRDAVGYMLKAAGEIDVIVPRGGQSLTSRVAAESKVPTILHLDGNCHTYIHASADLQKAIAVTLNAKMRRTGICGATESLLIDEKIADKILPEIVQKLSQLNCEVVGDNAAQKIDSRIGSASDDDWGQEYLSAKISVKIVSGVDEAIQHVNKYSSHHTDAIIAEDASAAAEFLNKVDSVIVMQNTSTQFADGGEFGMGAEIGISTGRLHARGPVGLAQLVTFKYVVKSDGATRP